ncbi:MAG: DUF4340 domain-containing protein [Rhodospirillales bacterium]|nr:DUF4340 domain-containing protein [Alphaproteobacteria bacterium]MBL6948125.1 DUF4340 domain-containing protein [Rhodospirillales bacterium]
MSPKSFTTLSLLTAAAVIAALVMIVSGRNDGPVAGAGDAAIPGLLQKANDVAAMSIEHAGGTITLSNGEDGWTVKEQHGYAARTIKVKRSILGLAQLILKEPKTRLKKKFAKLELRDTSAQGAQSKRVRLYDKAGQLIGDIIVGKGRPGLAGTTGGGLYIRNPGEDQTWLAAGQAQGSVDLSKKVIDWLERKIVHVDSQRVKRAVLKHPDGETLEVVKATKEESLFALNDIPADKKLISAMEPTTIGKALSNLVLDDVKKEADTKPFDAAKTITAEFFTFDGLTVRVRLTERDGGSWIKLDASGDHADAKAISKRTRGWVYRIADYTASTFTRRMNDLVEAKAAPKK